MESGIFSGVQKNVRIGAVMIEVLVIVRGLLGRAVASTSRKSFKVSFHFSSFPLV